MYVKQVCDQVCVCLQDSKPELRPRLCRMKKGSTGYGFNLHSDKNKPGQYIRAVDAASPAEKAGLRPQDKIIQVGLHHTHTHVGFSILVGPDRSLSFKMVIANP